jgi:poly-gamma-glutamate synthesis protein (capsule biosynthesis protein)
MAISGLCAVYRSTQAMKRLIKQLSFLICFLFSMYMYAQNSDPVILDKKLFDEKRPLEKELTVKVLDGFTLATVGDCIISRPLIQYAERNNEFARLLKILQQSDTLYGNLETTIFDIREFKGYPFSWIGDWVLVAEPGVAKDLALMGFDLFSRANNHVADWGLEGMRETSKWLDTSGIVHAGAGENEGLARAARYFESRKGRIGLISMASSFRPTSDALPARDSSPARPGVNALNVKSITTVPNDVMNTLIELRRKLYPKEEPPNAAKGVNIFEIEFEIGKNFGYRHEMNQ